LAVVDQIMLYVKSVLFPPFGILWAYKYLRHSDSKSKMVGIIAIIITLGAFVLSLILFQKFMNDLNAQMSKQLDGLYF
jgi:uncharacterized membrane protein YsdA (DUF1294 family)